MFGSRLDMGDANAAMIDSDDRPRSAASGGLELDVVASDHGDANLIPDLVAWAERAATHLGLGGQVRVRLVRDAEMAALHERTTGVPGTTDVLTFDLRDDPGAANPVLDVDVVLCTDEARRQSSERAHPVIAELTLYFVHALLHCTGHDDHDDAGYARMHEAEDRVLRAIGLGSVFAGSGNDSRPPDGGDR